jgi:hypothetical protein
MPRSRRIVPAALLIAAVTQSALAQESEPNPLSVLAAGSRVRVAGSALGVPVKGVLLSLDDKVLRLAPDGGAPLSIPVASITAADLSVGRKRQGPKGALWGTAIGLAVGVLMPVDPDNCGPNTSNFCSRGEGVGGGALAGAFLGFMIGSFRTKDDWAPLALPGRPVPAPLAPGSLGASVTIRF